MTDEEMKFSLAISELALEAHKSGVSADHLVKELCRLGGMLCGLGKTAEAQHLLGDIAMKSVVAAMAAGVDAVNDKRRREGRG